MKFKVNCVNPTFEYSKCNFCGNIRGQLNRFKPVWLELIVYQFAKLKKKKKHRENNNKKISKLHHKNHPRTS